jgi:hypothetical protein
MAIGVSTSEYRCVLVIKLKFTSAHFFQRRRRDIFVETQTKNSPAPSGRPIPFGERTRRACRFGRRAQTSFVRQTARHTIFGGTPKITRETRVLPGRFRCYGAFAFLISNYKDASTTAFRSYKVFLVSARLRG